MRIFIRPLAGKKFPLQAKSSDTIHHVKGLFQEKGGFCRLNQKLIFGERQLEDSRTLADYNIPNESIIEMEYNVGGGMHIHIVESNGNHFIIEIRAHAPTINDVKAVIEGDKGIPVSEQRLIFSGEELEDGSSTVGGYGIRDCSTLHLFRLPSADDVVDIAAVKARKKAAALSKDIGTENQDEAEVGSKSSSAIPRQSKMGLSSIGANRGVEGAESFWDEEDFGLAWRRSRSLISPYDMSRFESKTHRTLVESVANDCVRTLNVTTFLENQLEEYQDKLVRAENEVMRLTKENGYMEDCLEKNNKILKKLRLELDVECSTGTSFLQSEDGRRHIVNLVRSGVDEFKKSDAFKELVMDRAVSVYEDTVKECQRLLRKSGRVPEDIIQLISSRDDDEKDVEREAEERKRERMVKMLAMISRRGL